MEGAAIRKAHLLWIERWKQMKSVRAFAASIQAVSSLEVRNAARSRAPWTMLMIWIGLASQA
jgi:hypothetical protein